MTRPPGRPCYACPPQMPREAVVTLVIGVNAGSGLPAFRCVPCTLNRLHRTPLYPWAEITWMEMTR